MVINSSTELVNECETIISSEYKKKGSSSNFLKSILDADLELDNKKNVVGIN